MQTVLWRALVDRSGCNDADRSAGSSPWTEGVRHGGVQTRDVICDPGRASEGMQKLGVVCQLSLGCGLFHAELGGTEGAERVGQRLQVIRKNSGAGLDVDGLQQQLQVPKHVQFPMSSLIRSFRICDHW